MKVWVKICGLLTIEDVKATVAAGADAIGFVFAESPRQIDAQEAAALLAVVPAHVERIAVFRRPAAGELAAIAHLPLTSVQARADWDRAGLPMGWGFLPSHRDAPSLEGLQGRFLLDGAHGGGLGQAPDMRRARELARGGEMILAGGLRPDTVADAIRVVRPFGVDVSSGVESRRGVKDPARIRAFVRAVRETEGET